MRAMLFGWALYAAGLLAHLGAGEYALAITLYGLAALFWIVAIADES